MDVWHFYCAQWFVFQNTWLGWLLPAWELYLYAPAVLRLLPRPLSCHCWDFPPWGSRPSWLRIYSFDQRPSMQWALSISMEELESGFCIFLAPCSILSMGTLGDELDMTAAAGHHDEHSFIVRHTETYTMLVCSRLCSYGVFRGTKFGESEPDVSIRRDERISRVTKLMLLR